MVSASVETWINCPYCGQPISLWIDLSGGRTQHYVEDCAVCCHPLDISVEADEDGEVRVAAERQDE